MPSVLGVPGTWRNMCDAPPIISASPSTRPISIHRGWEGCSDCLPGACSFAEGLTPAGVILKPELCVSLSPSFDDEAGSALLADVLKAERRSRSLLTIPLPFHLAHGCSA